MEEKRIFVFVFGGRTIYYFGVRKDKEWDSVGTLFVCFDCLFVVKRLKSGCF